MRLCWTLGVAAACFAAHAYAADAECPEASAPGHPLANRAETIVALEQMPESCLKALLAECSENANRRLLDLGSAAVCSMGYEALLRKSFGGSFRAMMAWWERDRDARLVP